MPISNIEDPFNFFQYTKKELISLKNDLDEAIKEKDKDLSEINQSRISQLSEDDDFKELIEIIKNLSCSVDVPFILNASIEEGFKRYVNMRNCGYQHKFEEQIIDELIYLEEPLMSELFERPNVKEMIDNYLKSNLKAYDLLEKLKVKFELSSFQILQQVELWKIHGH